MLEIFKDLIPQHSSSQVLEWHASPSGLWLLPNDFEGLSNLNFIRYSHFRESYIGRERGLKSCIVDLSPSCAVQLLSCVWLFVTPWTVAHQAPLSMGYSRQDWSGLPLSSPGDLPNPGIKHESPTIQAVSLPSEPQGKLRVFRSIQSNIGWSLVWNILQGIYSLKKKINVCANAI